jgi:Cu2+-exporting ATPase
MIAEEFHSATAATAADRRLCSHCGLHVPAGLVNADREQQFCCHGCEAAYSVIHGCGLDAYYRMRRENETAAQPAKGTGKRYSEFDDAVFRRLYTRDLAEGLFATELLLEGIHCAACVWLLEKLPSIITGVVEARLDIRRSLVRIVWRDSEASLSRIARALDALGYPPHPARNTSARDIRRLDDRRMLVRLGVAGACAGNVMLLGLALYAGLFDAMEPQYRQLFRWASMAISLVSLAWPGSVFFRGAWTAIRTRTANLDLPIAMGLGAGAIWGVMNTIRGTGEIYFDSLSVLVLALLAGRLIQHRQQRWAADSLELLFLSHTNLGPPWSWRVHDRIVHRGCRRGRYGRGARGRLHPRRWNCHAGRIDHRSIPAHR